MLIAVGLYLQITYNVLVVDLELQNFDLEELKDLHYQPLVVLLINFLEDFVSEFLLIDLLFDVILEYQFLSLIHI